MRWFGVHMHGNRYSAAKNDNLNFHWQLLGIDHQHQKKIDPGLAANLWMPLPISLYIATVMKNYVCLMLETNPGAYGSKQWRSVLNEVGKHCKVLDATAGAGGCTIGLSMAFGHVFAGDFCEQQLTALRNNIMVVNEGSNVTIDTIPIDVLTRQDISKYHTMVISPFWGGDGYKQLPPGSADLYLNHKFTPNVFNNQLFLKTGKNVDQFIVDTMGQNPHLMFITLHIPYNFNAHNLLHNYLPQNGLKGELISPHYVPPSQINANTLHSFQGNHHQLVSATDIEHWKHFHKFDGSDRFILVFREEELNAKLNRLKLSDHICPTCNKAIKLDDTMQLSGGFNHRSHFAKKATGMKKGVKKPANWRQWGRYEKDAYIEQEFDMNDAEYEKYEELLNEYNSDPQDEYTLEETDNYEMNQATNEAMKELLEQ
jgi:hypothetical protein